MDMSTVGVTVKRSNQFRQRPMQHGTRSMYVLMKCRCKVCKDENTTYLTFYRERRKGVGARR